MNEVAPYRTAHSLRPPLRPYRGPAAAPVVQAPPAVQVPAPGLLDRTRDLVRRIDETYYDLALNLAELVRQGVPGRMGYADGNAGLASFLERELGLGLRKGRYLLAVADTFRGSSVPAEKVAAVGWTKAREMSGVPAPALPALVEYAATHTVPEVAAAAREARGAARTGEARKSRRAFFLHEDQAELLDAALLACKSRAQSPVDDAGALYLLAAEWLMQSGELLPRDAAVAVLERAYGIRITVEEATQ